MKVDQIVREEAGPERERFPGARGLRQDQARSPQTAVVTARTESHDARTVGACPSSGSVKMPLRVLLADDHQVVRQGLGALLGREGFTVVGEASDGLDAVRLAHTLCPDVVIMDLAMPLLNGIAATREILRGCPQTRTILLTMYTEDSFVLEALRAGVRGYVTKTQVAEDLLVAIQEVAQGKVYLCPEVSHTVVQAFLTKADLPSDSLSPREEQVLQLLVEGKSTKETARLLGISAKTVESHRHHIMMKLDIHDMPGLVRHAIRRGLIQS